ncbi:MAG: single-stranded-DNA-specific exonuclease RecJ, partial [Thiotrichales bacterium]
MSSIKPKIIIRTTCSTVLKDASKCGISDFLANIVAGRTNTQDPTDTCRLEKIINPSLRNMANPKLLKNAEFAATRIVQAINNQEHFGIVTDYDVDGITSHAIIYNALLTCGVDKQYLHSFIGHRINDGYGVSENLVNKILKNHEKVSVIITADCGSSDEKRITTLKENNIDVIVSDHHMIPDAGVPKSAYAVVNPIQHDCEYPDKVIAGCMVSWLLMAEARNVLVKQSGQQIPTLSNLLDYVSLGTVADAVSLLNPTNRAIVLAGITLINNKQRPCWMALYKLLKKNNAQFTCEDLGFQIGPRINARGRVDDPHAALHFLMAKDLSTADKYLNILDKDNQQRRYIEKEMLTVAKQQAEQILLTNPHTPAIVCTDASFHLGVQGIVASRLVDAYGKPAIVLSGAKNPEHLVGSSRSTCDIHIKHALDYIAKQHPDIFIAYGGHKAAAGLTILKKSLDIFKSCLQDAIIDQTQNAP